MKKQSKEFANQPVESLKKIAIGIKNGRSREENLGGNQVKAGRIMNIAILGILVLSCVVGVTSLLGFMLGLAVLAFCGLIFLAVVGIGCAIVLLFKK